MSVNHYLLPITDTELASLLHAPTHIHDLIEQRSDDILCLDEDGIAIVALTAESDQDPLAFLQVGAPAIVSGHIGKYLEKNGHVVICEVDLGYGPASYYKNAFLQKIAPKLQLITTDNIAPDGVLDFLEENHVYPSGWHDEGRLESLLQSFQVYRSCILNAATTGQHLLAWCA